MAQNPFKRLEANGDFPGSPFSDHPSSPSSSAGLMSGSRPSPAFMDSVSKSQHNDGFRESPYATSKNALSSNSLVSEKFSFAPDPKQWGADLSTQLKEEDDDLHDPRSRRFALDSGGFEFSARGMSNLGCLFILAAALITLFAGYPIISFFTEKPLSTMGGFNIGGINATGQVPAMGNWGLIDKDTPRDVYTKPGWLDGTEMELVFSDEFEQEGRTFYPGDDPYWEAADLHYWGTNNLEWYDPSAVTTIGGNLRVTLSQKLNHDLNYTGGLITSWNKFCFTGGLIETRVSLPGQANVPGLWPAVWTLGNLGRAGYGATLDGLWPYTYDTCDVGTVANQTRGGLPQLATVGGDAQYGGSLSYLPGQRLSRCTCPGESHPGPMHSDGTFVGRAAPEIDVFEATVSGNPLRGEVSQSSQWAPFNYAYQWFNSSDNLFIADPEVSLLNPYMGGAWQQATSVISHTNQDCYTQETGCFSIYGFEYKPGYDEGYITWINDGKLAWTFKGPGAAADNRVEIGPRPVPQEPMYIIINLGMSHNFGAVDFENLVFPTFMDVDYVRVYQPKGTKNIGCDPPDYPTAKYINTYIEAYTNPNLTTWVDDYKQEQPKNSFLGEC